jgi:uncharacterized protein
MAAVKTDQEPSIEEILESIRQIISEDGSEAETPAKPAPTAAPAKPQPQPQPQPQQAAKASPPPPPPKPAKPVENVLDLTEKVVPEEESVAVPEVTIELKDAMQRQLQASGDDLLSDAAADASAAAMSKLMAGNIAVDSQEPGRVGSVTLEDMVRELMRPMIKTWLDNNLPGIIERMVQREIEKVSRRAMDR